MIRADAPASLRRRALAAFDARMYRRPFEGRIADRYLAARRAFGDFDDRVLDAIAEHLSPRARLLEVGAGPAVFCGAAKRRFPYLEVVALEPSRDLSQVAARASAEISVVRGSAEQLPFADASVAAAVCLSSIRHVKDRARALAELRRVIRPGGVLLIAELDPSASRQRVDNHARALEPWWLRAAFGALIVRTAPSSASFVATARAAGFELVRERADPIQPLYLLELL